MVRAHAEDLIQRIGSRPTYAVGTPNIPFDQLAMVHKGESIIPKTFAEGIRSGDLTLSGPGAGQSSGESAIIVNVTVQGSVQTENDLATSIAKAIARQRKMGVLTV